MVVFAVGLVGIVWWIFAPKSFEGADKADPRFRITLGEYAEKSQDDRAEMVQAMVLAHSEPKLMTSKYVNCMGDMAHNKQKSVNFNTAFSWCKINRKDHKVFSQYFDELSTKDWADEASSVCKKFMTARLTSPGTADHPFGGSKVWYLKKDKYRVKSYVDAQNGFGAVVRLNYNCDVKYKGSGDGFMPNSWNLLDLSF